MEGQRSYRYASCLESSLCVELQPRHGARLALHWCFEMNGARPPPMVLCRARTKLIVVRVRTLRSHCPFFCFAAAGRTRWFGSSTRAPLIVANTIAHSAEKLSGWIYARDTYVCKQLYSTRSAGCSSCAVFMANTYSECARKAKELLRQRLLSKKGFDIGVLESRRGALRYARGRGASWTSTLTLSGRSWLAKFCCTLLHTLLSCFYFTSVLLGSWLNELLLMERGIPCLSLAPKGVASHGYVTSWVGCERPSNIISTIVSSCDKVHYLGLLLGLVGLASQTHFCKKKGRVWWTAYTSRVPLECN